MAGPSPINRGRSLASSKAKISARSNIQKIATFAIGGSHLKIKASNFIGPSNPIFFSFGDNKIGAEITYHDVVGDLVLQELRINTLMDKTPIEQQRLLPLTLKGLFLPTLSYKKVGIAASGGSELRHVEIASDGSFSIGHENPLQIKMDRKGLGYILITVPPANLKLQETLEKVAKFVIPVPLKEIYLKIPKSRIG